VSRSSSVTITENRYYMTVHYGIGHGELDSINHVFVKEKLIWSGTQESNAEITVDLPDLFGGYKKEGGVRGVLDFYLGTPDQLMTAAGATRYSKTPSTMPGYRGVASVLFRGTGNAGGFWWGSNNPYLPPAEINVTDIPRLLGDDFAEIVDPEATGRPFEGTESLPPLPDANPSHIIYECLRDDDWGMGTPSNTIDVESFEDAAEVLHGENFGLSMMWNQQSTIEAYIQEVVDHIQAVLFIDPDTGQWRLRLLRDDYDLQGDGVEVNESNAVATNRQRKGYGETINEIVIEWTDPVNEQIKTVAFQNIAGITTQSGGPVSDTRNYYGVRNPTLAAKLGARDIQSASYPLFSCDLVVSATLRGPTGRIKPGDILRFSWAADGIVNMPLRVYKVDYGKPGDEKIRLQVTEDIFGIGTTSYAAVPPSLWEDPSAPPEPLEEVAIITPPTSFLQRAGLEDLTASGLSPDVVMGVLGGSDSQDVTGIRVMGNKVKANGDIEMDQLSEIGATKYAYLTDGWIAEAETVLNESQLALILPGTATPEEGDLIMLGYTDTLSEIVMLDQHTGSSWTLARGVHDTIPREWPAGTIVWYIGQRFETIEPSENASDVASFYRLRTITSGGVLPLVDTPTTNFTPSDRTFAPYRPANPRLDGEAVELIYLEGFVPVNITATWALRNRTLEDAIIARWSEASVSPESGQTTTIRVRSRADGTILNEYTGLTGTTFNIPVADLVDERLMVVEFLAERDGFESIQFWSILLEVELVGYGYNYGFNYGGA
jgi:hypothetical protein